METALIVAGMVLVITVFAAMVVHIGHSAADALHMRRMRDGSSIEAEPPTLNVQNHIGDPDDPTTGAH